MVEVDLNEMDYHCADSCATSHSAFLSILVCNGYSLTQSLRLQLMYWIVTPQFDGLYKWGWIVKARTYVKWIWLRYARECSDRKKCIIMSWLFVTNLQLTIYLLFELPAYLASLLNFEILSKFHHSWREFVWKYP